MGDFSVAPLRQFVGRVKLAENNPAATNQTRGAVSFCATGRQNSRRGGSLGWCCRWGYACADQGIWMLLNVPTVVRPCPAALTSSRSNRHQPLLTDLPFVRLCVRWRWPWFHRWVRHGLYHADWAGSGAMASYARCRITVGWVKLIDSGSARRETSASSDPMSVKIGHECRSRKTKPRLVVAGFWVLIRLCVTAQVAPALQGFPDQSSGSQFLTYPLSRHAPLYAHDSWPVAAPAPPPAGAAPVTTVGVRTQVSAVVIPLKAFGVAVITAVVAVNAMLFNAPVVLLVGRVSLILVAVSHAAKLNSSA